MGRDLPQCSGDCIASSSCPLMLIQGKAAAKPAALPCVLGMDVPPSAKAHTARAVAGITRALPWAAHVKSDLYGELAWQPPQGENPAVVSWCGARDYTAIFGQQVKRRACVANIAG